MKNIIGMGFLPLLIRLNLVATGGKYIVDHKCMDLIFARNCVGKKRKIVRKN